MIRRLALVAAAALVAAPFISVGSASAAETVIAKCTSAKGSTKLLPGLGHDKKSQTGTSPDTKTGATPDSFSGCSKTAGGGPSSGVFTASITSTQPLACPHALGGPTDPPVGTIIFTGSTHIAWNTGATSNGTVKVKQTATVGQVRVITTFTSGTFFKAGHTTKARVTFAFSPNQSSFDCTTAGNPNPLKHFNISNVGDLVVSRV